MITGAYAVVYTRDPEADRELYLPCDAAQAFVDTMAARGVACTPVTDQGWALLPMVTPPGGGRLGVYQPRHARPASS